MISYNWLQYCSMIFLKFIRNLHQSIDCVVFAFSSFRFCFVCMLAIALRNKHTHSTNWCSIRNWFWINLSKTSQELLSIVYIFFVCSIYLFICCCCFYCSHAQRLIWALILVDSNKVLLIEIDVLCVAILLLWMLFLDIFFVFFCNNSTNFWRFFLLIIRPPFKRNLVYRILRWSVRLCTFSSYV